MAKLQVRRTKTAGVKPTPTQILEGELVVNLSDKKLYTKNDSGVVIQIGNPEQADKLDIATSLTVGGGASIQNGAIIAKSLEVTGKDSFINIGSGDPATPGVNFKVSSTKTQSIKATDQSLELTADRVDIKGGKLSLNPLGAGEIQGKGQNKIMSDDGQGNVTLSGSRDGTTPGLLILGGKTQGHNTQAVKLRSDLVNSAGDVLIDITTGKIRTAMLDTVFTTPTDVAGIYYNKGEADAKYQTIANTTANFYNRTQIATVLTDYYTKTAANAAFQTIAGMANFYTVTAADAKFQTIAADATRNYSKTETDTKLATLATKTELTTLSNSVYSKTALDTILLDGYLNKTQLAATYQTVAADAARNYSKTESDSRYYDKTTADGRYFGKQAGNIEMDSYLLSKAVDGTQATNNTSMAFSGFYRMNQDQNQLGGLNIHVAHPLYGANHSRGISFTYGSNGYGMSTYRYDANGVFIGAAKIYTAGDKPTAAELGVLPSSGTANLNGALSATGNISGSEFIASNGNGFRVVQGGIGSFIRNDGVSTYFMSTALNDPLGGWSGIRPFRWNNLTGLVNIGNGLEVNGSFYVNGSTITTGDITNTGNLTVGSRERSNFTLIPSGGSASAFTLSNWGSAGRRNVWELTDDLGWLFYAQRESVNNTVQLSINGALSAGTITAASTVGGDYGSFNYMGIGTANGLGAKSIAIGDNDTGLKQNGDGVLEIHANAAKVATYNSQWVSFHKGCTVEGDFYSSGTVNATASVYSNSNANSHYWFHNADRTVEKGVIYAGLDGVIRYRAQGDNHIFENTVTVNKNIIVGGNGILVNGLPYTSDRGLIRGNVPGGGWVDWQNRPAGLLIDVADHASSAYNIFKVTQWGHSHRCSLDYHGSEVRLHTQWGGDFVFSGNNFVVPGEIQTSGGGTRVLTDGNILGPVFDSGNLKQELNNIRASANGSNNSINAIRLSALAELPGMTFNISGVINTRDTPAGCVVTGLRGGENNIYVRYKYIQVHIPANGWFNAVDWWG